MEEAIRKIIEIEHEAQSLVAEGYAQIETIKMGTLAKLKNMECNILEMSEYKIEELRKKSRSDADEKIKIINENTERKIRALEVYVENTREIWENQIFNRILGR